MRKEGAFRDLAATQNVWEGGGEATGGSGEVGEAVGTGGRNGVCLSGICLKQ